MTDIRLFGYADPLSAQAGKPIDFMVSAEGTHEVKAELVRLVHGDFNPEGPGFVEETVASDIPATLGVKRQYTQNGSFARVDDADGYLAPGGAFTVHACFQVHWSREATKSLKNDTRPLNLIIVRAKTRFTYLNDL